MRVFVTGASGWIGSAVTEELQAHGHHVMGLARSEASAARITAFGADVARGELTDLDVLKEAASTADAVIHLGFVHDFARFAESGLIERAAVAALGETLAGTDRALLLASGVAFPKGRPLTELDPSTHVGAEAPRGGSEALAMEFADRGVRTVALRFAPTVHGRGDHGFSATIAGVARRTGVSGYIGDGANRWPAVHRSDAATLVRLALEGSPAGSIVHAVAEEGIPTLRIAEAHAAVLGVPARSIAPDDAAAHFGWIAGFWGLDAPTSSALTRERLGWAPSGPTLLEDIADGVYAEATPHNA